MRVQWGVHGVGGWGGRQAAASAHASVARWWPGACLQAIAICTLGTCFGCPECRALQERQAHHGGGGGGGGVSPQAPQYCEPPPPSEEVHMQVAVPRESEADVRKLHVGTGTHTLTLRAETK